jgi:hypothetical protein
MSAYSDLILATAGLVGYWRLGEASGAAVDLKNARNGTVTGATYGQTGLLTGDSDKAMLFDADGEKVVITDNAAFAMTTGLSIEAWVRLDSNPASTQIMGRRTAANLGGYILGISSGGAPSIEGYLGVATWQNATGAALTPGATVHLVGTFDGAFLRLYKNGTQETFNVQDWTGFPISDQASSIVSIGHSPIGANASFRGVIDEVALYNAALSPATIAEHYALGLNGPATGQRFSNFQLRPIGA